MVVPEVSEFYRPTYSSLNLGISAFTRSNSRRLMPISFAACSRVTRSTRGPSSWPRNSLITVLCKGPAASGQGKGTHSVANPPATFPNFSAIICYKTEKAYNHIPKKGRAAMHDLVFSLLLTASDCNQLPAQTMQERDNLLLAFLARLLDPVDVL